MKKYEYLDEHTPYACTRTVTDVLPNDVHRQRPGLVITLHGLAVFTPAWKPATPGTVAITAEVT